MPNFFKTRSVAVLLLILIVFASVVILATGHTQANMNDDSIDDTQSKRTSKPSPRLQELDAKMKNKGMLLLRAAEFDPLQEVPKAVTIGSNQLEMTKASASKLASTEAQISIASYLIVQFSDTIQPAQTEKLRKDGYEIKAYIPNNAYLVNAPAKLQAQLMSNASREFRWVGAYGAGLKIEPELAQLANASSNKNSSEAASNMMIAFNLFSGEKADAVKAALAAMNLQKKSDVIEAANRASGMVEVSSTELPTLLNALANIEGVEWIERYARPKPENDNGVKIIQSSTVTGTNVTPLYKNGLTGTGQIIGFADSGIDTDHAQFRFSADVAAQTLSYATTTSALVNGFLPFSVTNPNNKILTYYVMGRGSLIDNTNNPNGGKVLDPNEMLGGAYRNAVAYDDNGGYHGTHVVSVGAGRDYAADGSGAVQGITTRTSNDGVARDARIVFQDVGHPDDSLDGLSVGQALIMQQAYDTGVRVHSQSWGAGTNPSYNTSAADDDEAMWKLRDLTIFYSAGNSGPAPLTITKDTKNGILVGGTNSPTNGGSIEDLSTSSSHGPTRDGRIKPDILAPYRVNAATETAGISGPFANPTSTTAMDAAVNPSAPNNNRSFSGIQGTSFSSPMAAGGAILARQYFTDGYYPSGARTAANSFNPSNALIKAIVLNSGRNVTGLRSANDGTGGASAPLPNNGQGWGRMTLDDVLYFPGDRRELKVVADIWNGATATDASRPAPNASIMTGQTHTYQIANVSTVEPLRITLVWADPKGSTGAAVALTNNLDLEVTDPQGKIFRGNVNFASAYSQPSNGAAFDNRNPLESVYVQYPVPGTYTVKIIGTNVPGNGQMGIVAQPGNQTIDSNRQGYALVTTGNFTAGAVPILALNKSTISGGVNADRFISRNETSTATLNINNLTAVISTNVTAQISVAASSQVPANLVRINGQPAGQAASLAIGDIAAATSVDRAIQITLLNDASLQAGQIITFDVNLTQGNGAAVASQFTVTIAQKLLTYRTRFEPTADPGEAGVIVIPEADWGLRSDNPAPALSTDAFAGNWLLTTAMKAAGSTASLGDPSGVGAGYGVSSTSRAGFIYDDTRWWTNKKIVLPGLTVASDKVSNPALAQQLKFGMESYSVDLKTDFTGDSSTTNPDFFVLRIRTYRNTSLLSDLTDTGFNSASFLNAVLIDSAAPASNGFRRYAGSTFLNNNLNGDFSFDTTTPDNSDVAFRVELQLRRNDIAQTGDGVFIDNLELKLRSSDLTVYSTPSSINSVTVNGANFTPAQVAPGALVSTFGNGLPTNLTIDQGVTAFPLPTVLGGISVRVNGMLAPLLYVGAGTRFGSNGAFQINYQLPFEASPGMAFVEVLNNGTAVTSEFLNVQNSSPGVFSFTSDGRGQIAALNQDYQANGSSRPEARGRVIQIYATGTGTQLIDSVTRLRATLPTATAPPGDGSKLFLTENLPTVTIGGIPATVEFSGLAPGYVGLWQVNVRIPSNATTGNAVPVVVSLDGRTSNQTTVAVN